MGSRFCYFIFISFIIVSCSSVKKVDFETPVDTTSKPIVYQVRKDYELKDLGIYASNNFDGARLNGFELENDSTAFVIINPENQPINNSPYYAFKTWSSSPKDFYFTFVYPKGFKHRYVPKLFRNGIWQTIDSTQIFLKDSIVSIKLNLSTTPLLVAAQEIQSSTDVQDWYENLATENKGLVKVKSFGETTLGRNLPVLDISLGNDLGKEVIILLTRQHPPEVTGYYAFQNFLKTILSGSEQSKLFLKRFRVLAFPIMNPDGVDLGHWRHNAGGVDTNRDWSRYEQPEIEQAVTFIHKTLKKNKSKILLGLDFHSTWYDVFYTNESREGTTLPDFEKQWFSALELNIPDYKVNEMASNSKKPVSKGWFLYGNTAVGITYEIGDATPIDKIELIGRVSAEEMMRILLNTTN